MKRMFILLVGIAAAMPMLAGGVSAATTHTVVSGDSLWKIANRYRIGLSEIKSATPLPVFNTAK